MYFSVQSVGHFSVQINSKVLNMAWYSDSGQFGKQFGDEISSIMLGKNSKVYFEVYTDANYNGGGNTYTGGRTETFYKSVENLGYTNVGHDSVSSIKVRTCENSTLLRCRERYNAVIPDSPAAPGSSETQKLKKPKATGTRR